MTKIWIARYCSKKLYQKVMFDKVRLYIGITYNPLDVWSYTKIMYNFMVVWSFEHVIITNFYNNLLLLLFFN